MIQPPLFTIIHRLYTFYSLFRVFPRGFLCLFRIFMQKNYFLYGLLREVPLPTPISTHTRWRWGHAHPRALCVQAVRAPRALPIRLHTTTTLALCTRRGGGVGW